VTHDPLADLIELMGGARGLALRVWDAGWRPPTCSLCPLPATVALCAPCAAPLTYDEPIRTHQ